MKIPSRLIRRLLTGLMLILLSACQPQQQAAPMVVSTIKPVQALVFAIAGGHIETRQLLPDGASPHHYALKPSDMRLLESAQAIFRIGGGLETFLDKPLANLDPQRVVTLASIPGIKHLSSRTPHEHDGDEKEEQDTGEHGQEPDHSLTEDLHLWLNPDNAIVMTRAIAAKLAAIDPSHQADYQGNAEKLIQQIQTADTQIRAQLAPVRNLPFLVFHDAWQHFDTHYGLTFAGAVTLDVSRQPGARHVRDIRQLILNKQAVCLFQEPQFAPSLITTLAEGTNIHIGTLDPLGMKLKLDENMYIRLLQTAADSFQHCLSH